HVVAVRLVRDAENDLAVERLVVEPALAGEAHVAPLEAALEVDRFEHERDAGPEPRTEKRHEPEAHAAGRARPGRVLVIHADLLAHELREMREPGVEVVARLRV